MAATRKKKYRPKPVLTNPVGYVLEGLAPVTSYTDELLALRIRNHAAMAALTQGRATKADINTLITAVNITEACFLLGVGHEYEATIKAGQEALRSVGRRGAESNRFVLRAEEMQALNEMMELHDAQFDVLTMKELTRAIELVQREMRLKRAIPINPKETTDG